MTISSTTSRNDYTGNGVTGTYSYAYKILSDTDHLVTVRDTSDAETTLVLTTDYTVTGAGNVSGGTIVLVEAGQSWMDGSGNLISGYTITLRRSRPLTQTTDIRNQGPFYPASHENAFDHGVMLAQALDEEMGRSVQLPETISSDDFDPTLPTNIESNAGLAIVVNAGGTGLSLAALPGTFDTERFFKSTTYDALKALAVADPTTQRWGWASDLQQLMFYTAITAIGDDGWIMVGG